MKFRNNHRLRKPGGPYVVGCTQFAFDYAPEDDPVAGPRTVPCLCFYPADGVGEAKRKPYIRPAVLPGAGAIETNSYLFAPAADGTFPLLIFNHGYGLFCESNTVQFEELASHGYTVLSIGHPGGGSYELPDGRIMHFDIDRAMETPREFALKNMEIFPPYSAWLTRDGWKAEIDVHRKRYQTIIKGQVQWVAQSNLWREDSLAALAMLETSGDTGVSLIRDHADTRTIGAFGMSLGGAVALGLARDSDRILAAADLDGFYYHEGWETPLAKPLLLLQDDSLLAGHLLIFPYLNAEGDVYLATVKGSGHGNFADFNEILAENYIATAAIADQNVGQAMLGDIDPERMGTILNMLLLDFFNKYLKGEKSRALDMDDLPDEVDLRRKQADEE